MGSIRRIAAAALALPLLVALTEAGPAPAQTEDRAATEPTAQSDPGPPDAAEDAKTDPASDPDEPGLPPIVPRPEFMRNKPFIPDLLLREKREGRYVTGMPAIGWDDEEGFNLGAFAEFYDNGSKDDPFFRTAPYRRKAFLGAVFATAGVIRILGRWDQPYINDSPYRLRVDLLVEENPINNYFGVGDDSLKKLNYPGFPGNFDTYAEYRNSVDRRLPDGTTYATYNQYQSTEVRLETAVERDMMGGLLRPLVGLKIGHVDVNDYTFDKVSARGGKAIQRPTKLFEDCVVGIVTGCNGGWDNYLKLGLSYDTRDFEPDPSQGILAQGTAEISTKLLGSQFEYQRLTFSTKLYYSLFPELTRLVFASRITYSMQFGAVPVFSLPYYAYNTRDRKGLGGLDTFRGYKRNRFVGRSGIIVNGELRWSFAETNFVGQHLRFALAPFVDTGRIFDEVDLSMRNWRIGYGAGLRLIWNLSTVISFDLGLSGEDEIFYMELGTQF